MKYTCKRCGRVVAATHQDPIAVVARGNFHVACLVADGQEQRAAEEQAREAVTARKD